MTIRKVGDEWYCSEIISKEFVKLFNTLDLQFEPGSRFNYSNSGYYLLGLIIEKITGKPFNKVVYEVSKVFPNSKYSKISFSLS